MTKYLLLHNPFIPDTLPNVIILLHVLMTWITLLLCKGDPLPLSYLASRTSGSTTVPSPLLHLN